MDSESKHQKCEVEDRISNLPAGLISHILSLLPTKYAVRTSTLSTFWNQQWTSITQLRFDDALPPGTSSTPDTKASFVNFVFRVLLNIKVPCPGVFQLNCSQDYGVNYVDSWVSAALSRRVPHIDLTFSNVKRGLLPSSLFSSRYLVVLKLETGFVLQVPMLVSLDSLKILHLAVMFSDNDSLSRLVSSCPLLEELKVRISHYVNEVKISSVSLKRLILIGLNGLDPRSAHEPYSYEVVLNTPGLQYLEQRGCHVPNSYSMEILRCLDRAHVDVVIDYFRLLLIRQPIVRAARLARMRHTMTSFAVGISNIKFLSLSKDACEAFYHRILCKLPNFPHLIELEMDETHWNLLTAFLESSPKLATLSFRLQHKRSDKTLDPPTSVPFCMLSNLKKVEIKDFGGQPKELNIVSFFLEKSKCLSKLLIRYSSEITKEKEAEVSEKLLMLRRASTSCVVVVT